MRARAPNRSVVAPSFVGIAGLLVGLGCAPDEGPICESDMVGAGYVSAEGVMELNVDGTELSLAHELRVRSDENGFAVQACDHADGDQYYVAVSWLVWDATDFNFTEVGGHQMGGRMYRCFGGDTCLRTEPDWLFRTDDLLGLRPDRVDGSVFLSDRDRGRANGFFTVHQFDHVTQVEFNVQWEVEDEM